MREIPNKEENRFSYEVRLVKNRDYSFITPLSLSHWTELLLPGGVAPNQSGNSVQ